MPERKVALIVTCEHATNRVPEEFARLLVGRDELLASHRAYDPGTRELARQLAHRFSAPCHEATISRLLVDLNRSPGHRQLFHPSLSKAEQEALMVNHYRPFRQAAEKAIAGVIASGRLALHLSIHSFTPIFAGQERNADFSLLYDPSRPGEKTLCRQWLAGLRELDPELRLRRNYPYRGVSDGFATALRKRHGPEHYWGIEVEINQNQVTERSWQRLQEQIADSLKRALRPGNR